MHVVENESGFWFFLEENGEHFLDVNICHGVIDSSFLMKLSGDEYAEYTNSGAEYLSSLAIRITQSITTVPANKTSFKGRKITDLSIETKATYAIQDWHRAQDT